MQKEDSRFEAYLITSQIPPQRSLLTSFTLSRRVRTIRSALLLRKIILFRSFKDGDLPQERLIKLYKEILRAKEKAACELIDKVCST